MFKMKVLLDTMDKIKDFNCIVSDYKSEVDLTSGRYVIDAKSIMGIFSLDCSKPIEVSIYGEQAEVLRKVLEKFEAKD